MVLQSEMLMRPVGLYDEAEAEAETEAEAKNIFRG